VNSLIQAAAAFQQAGNLQAARDTVIRALAQDRRAPLPWLLLGIVTQPENPHRALRHYDRALRLNPELVPAAYNRAVLLQQFGRWDEAAAGYQQTLRLDPRHAEAWTNLGLLKGARGAWRDAIECHQHALRHNPQFAEAYNNLGTCLAAVRAFTQAVACYARAVELKPDLAAAFNNLGNTLLRMDRPREAIAALRQAAHLQPNLPEVHVNLGSALLRLRQFRERAPESATPDRPLDVDTDEAIACFCTALKQNPRSLSALGQLIHELQHQCAWEELPNLVAALLQTLDNPDPTRPDDLLPPFVFLTLPVPASPRQQQEVACHWARAAARLAMPGAPPRLSEDRRIRVGYLSADLRKHPVAELVVELLETHNRSRFAVTAYSYGPDDRSVLRHRIQNAVETFVDLRPVSLADAVERIRKDQIDILVDLTGFTQSARTEILASRPAPIQVNYLGYPGTLGADFVDYILVDHFIVPAEQQSAYHERLVHLPGCYQVNDSKRKLAGPIPSRPDLGLPIEGFVFCSFNSNYKITPRMFELWMQLLRQTPGSVLWLLQGNSRVPVNLQRAAERHGIASDRILFAPRLPLEQHLARHACADLFLDTFPVNAHTTASDALWAGLPVLTLCGETFISRVAGSLLHSLGLPELITDTFESYLDRALELAHSPRRLAELRARLAAARQTASVFQIVPAARAIEQAYETMVARCRAGLNPASFSITPEPNLPARCA